MRWDFTLLAVVYCGTLAYYLYRLLRFIAGRSGQFPILPRQWKMYRMIARTGFSNPTFSRHSASYLCTGSYRGRQAAIEYDYRQQEMLTIDMQITQKFWLKLAPHPGQNPAAPADGLDVETNQPEAAKDFLNDPHVESEITRVRSLRSFEIERGRLSLVVGFANDGSQASDLSDMLETANRLAHFYEIQASSLKVYMTVGAASICPYCRQKLDTLTESLFECEKCGAVMHKTCHEENQQCTTLGCGV